jgi:hypothetical protein
MEGERWLIIQFTRDNLADSRFFKIHTIERSGEPDFRSVREAKVNKFQCIRLYPFAAVKLTKSPISSTKMFGPPEG